MTPRLFDEDTMPSDVARALGGLAGAGPTAAPVPTSWGAASEAGRERPRNEDAWGHRAGEVFVLADGMGGRPAGDIAATAAVASLLDELAPGVDDIDWNRVMGRADEAVHAAGRRRGHDRLGAAVAALRSAGGRTVIAHAGDVRVYRLRGDSLECLTADHTVGVELEAAGIVAARVPAARGRLGALTAFLGGVGHWRGFSVRTLDARSGDRLIVCSDGVHKHLGVTEWLDAALLADAGALAERLVTSAIRRGGRDDATAVVVTLGAPT